MDMVMQLSEVWMEWQIRAFLLSVLIVFIALPDHWRSPIWRHWILVSGTLALLVFPFLIWALPDWELPMIPRQLLLDPFASPISLELGDASPNNWSLVLLALTTIASVVMISRYIIAMRALRRSFVSASEPDLATRQLFDICINKLDLKEQAVELRVRGTNTVPCTLGWLRPKVLIPENVLLSSEQDKRIVFIHELQHIKRKDWLWQQIAVSFLICYPLNPLAWKIKSMLRKLAEESVDKLSLAEDIAPMDYADALLRQLRDCKQMRSSAAVYMHQRIDIAERVNSLISEPYSWQRLNRLSSVHIYVLVLLLTIPLAVVKPIHFAIPSGNHEQQVSYVRELGFDSSQPEQTPIWVGNTRVVPLDAPSYPPALIRSWQISAETEVVSFTPARPNVALLSRPVIPVEPKPRHLEKPEYPVFELRRGREATIEVVFDLNDQGNVINPRITHSQVGAGRINPKRFENAAIEAIRASRYEIEDPYQRPLIMKDLTQTYIFEIQVDRRTTASDNLSKNPP